MENKEKISKGIISKESNYKSQLIENDLTSNNLFINKKDKQTRNFQKEKIKKRDSSTQSSLLLTEEHESIERKKRKEKEKKEEIKYIVDDINNILSLLKEPKLKLKIQEFLHYFIVVLICVYYWIFLFLSGIKFERNYYLTYNRQFEGCSNEQMCDFPENSLNIIIYNSSLKYKNISPNDDEFYIEESNIVNEVYYNIFIRYEQLLSKYKLTSTLTSDYINDKPMFGVVITNKEKWNLYYRYFSICEFENFYFLMIAILAVGGIIGSILFGLLSDLYGRKLIILITLFINFLGTLGVYLLSLWLDYYYEKKLDLINEKISFPLFENLLSEIYAQGQVKDKFKNNYVYFLFCIFLINLSLWPLLKTCMALVLENSKGDLEVLINFRKFNFVFQGLPPLITTLIFINVNNFTLTFLILSILSLITLILSYLFFDESIRYYYEYSEWDNLTKVLLNTYKINLNDFRTLNETEYKEFKKRENSKSISKQNFFLYNKNNQSYYMMSQSYYKSFTKIKAAFTSNLKRVEDFTIKLEDVKQFPILILTSLFENNSLKNSQTLLFIILVLLYIIMDLFYKELIEPPYFSVKDFYFGKGFNYIINSIFFIYLIINILSNYFYYFLYRIGCFKTIIYISQIIITIILTIYHFITSNVSETPMNFNKYNFYFISYFLRDMRSRLNLFFLFFTYFFLNGVIFYVYLLTIKISKTIHRCTIFSFHSIALIIANVISEYIYYYSENYFLFLGILNLLCLITFFFLSEFKELIYLMNDLKINSFGIRKYDWKEKFKSN